MKKRLPALLLALSLFLTACTGGASAATMRLRKAEGTVGVLDSAGGDVAPRENLGLYSGYQVGTAAGSFAWIDLDRVKLTKLDQNSEVAVTKEGEKLTLDVRAGSLFFNVTEPLAGGETMDIRNSSLLVGIRGTCGWVTENTAALLAGSVSVAAGDQTVTVSAGEMAVLTAQGTLEVKPFTAASVPAFVREEAAQDAGLAARIRESAGVDLAGSVPLADYADFLAPIEAQGKLLYTELLDLEQDGSPELLAIYTIHINEETKTDIVNVLLVRKDADGFSPVRGVYDGGVPWGAGEGLQVRTYALAEYGGRLYLEEYKRLYKPDSYGESRSWIFSTTQKDGARESWRWMYIDSVSSGGGTYFFRSGNLPGDESGYSEIDAADYAATRGQFTTVRVLTHLYTTDGVNEVVTSDASQVEEAIRAAAPGLFEPVGIP